MHGRPALLGAGLLHCRLRVIVSPLQDDHAPQQLQLPSVATSTTKDCIICHVSVSVGLEDKNTFNVTMSEGLLTRWPLSDLTTSPSVARRT